MLVVLFSLGNDGLESIRAEIFVVFRDIVEFWKMAGNCRSFSEDFGSSSKKKVTLVPLNTL